MFITKYSLLRRIISLTVASFMILAFTPGIGAIAQDFLINSPQGNSADPLRLIAYVNNNVTIAGTAPSNLGAGDWAINIYWDDYDPDATTEETIPYNASWSASHTYLPYTLAGEEKPPDGLKNISAKIFKDGQEYTDIDPAFPPALIVVDTKPPLVDDVAFALPSESTSSDTLNVNQTTGEVTVSGKVNINVEVTDWTKVSDRPGEVDKVEFYIDGMLKETDKTVGSDGRYSYLWDSTSLPVGDHTVKVIATDKAGNRSTDYTKTVTVKKHFEGTVSAETSYFPPDPNPLPFNEKVRLIIPAGALTGSSPLTLDILPSSLMSDKPASDVALRAYTFSSLTFNSPINVTFNYNDSEVNEGKLVVRKYDSTQKIWVYQNPTEKSIVNNTITIGTSSFSTYGLFEDKTAPAKPSNLAATAGDKKIDLSWSANTESDLAGYKVYYGTTAGSYGTPIDVGNVTSKSLTGLTNGTKYYVAVTAYDSVGNESEKSTREATPSVPPATPSAPTYTVGDGVINLTWSAVTEATGYKIYWGTSSGIYDKPTVDVVGGNVTSYKLTGLINGVPYYIAISAYNASAESSKSSQITATPSGNNGLTITKTVDKANASPNDTLTYTITYKNTGNSGLTNVQLTDQIPDGIDYLADSASTGGTYNSSAFILTWNIGNLAAGSSGTASFKVKIASSAAGIIVNTASIKSTEITPAMTDSASTTIAVASPVAATGGDATAAGTTGPATTAAATTAAAAGAAKKLPRTGMELLQYLFIAMLLIASGLGLQFVGRRKEM